MRYENWWARRRIQSQDELRRKLRRRGFAVTQATLSRDITRTASIQRR